VHAAIYAAGTEFMRESILSYLFDQRQRNREVAFIHRPGLRRKLWTFAEIVQVSFQFARELEKRNIGDGDRVILWAENSPGWIAAFFGIVLRRAIAVPLDEQSAIDFVQRVVDKTEPKLLLYGRDIDLSSLNVPSIALADLPRIVAGHRPEAFNNFDIKPDDTVEIVFTSGTTAEPKGVILTQENLMANLAPMEREIEKYIKWKFVVDPIKILCLLPLSHVFGQMMGMFLPLMLGAEVIFQDRLSPTEIVDTIKRERAMVVAAVPRILETLAGKVEREYEVQGKLNELHESVGKERSWFEAWWKFRMVHRMFGWKFVSFVTGGATLDESTENFWRKLGYAVVQGYGMTETAALVSLNNPFSARRGSLGQILAGRDNVRVNENGEILVRGKNISPGYWGETENGQDEWLNTGDIGALDETGRLYFKGRKKDVIVTAAGLNIYPEDLEAALNGQQETVTSAVVAVYGPNGPEPAAALILKPGSTASEVVRRANERLAPFQQIRRWIEWPDADFPRTTTHKIRKNLVTEAISKSSSQKSEESSSGFNKILARLGIAAGARSDARFSNELALDSLSRVELMSAIEDQYQIDLDERAFTETTTIADLEQLIRNRGVDANESPRFSFPRWPLRFPVSWTRPVFYELVIYPITRILCWANVRGTDNLSEIDGPVLFASNHVTYIDPALVMAAMPRRFRRKLAIAMDGERLRAYLHPPKGTGTIKRVRWFFTYWLVVTFFNAFPLPRQSGFRESFSFAGEAMDSGYNILIFPEGELTRDGSIQPFKSGLGILANGLEVPIVPVAITGLYKLRAAGQRGFAPPGRVTITFGEPVTFESDTSATEITTKLEHRIRELHL
jgi:long-chain acyl-CoA synthetase